MTAGNGDAVLRVGIIGSGFAGRIHARSARLAGARLIGVAASSPERGEEARGELGAERSYDSAEELATSDELDLVHVCAPNHLHVPLCLAALGAGKHVVCEKPIALDSRGAAELEEAAEAASKLVAVPFVYRYYPSVREARARIRSAKGGARLIHGGYLQDWLMGADDRNWRLDPALGGASRAFADIGSHWCDLVEFVSGQRIIALDARTANLHEERGTEDVAMALFETDGGATGSLLVSQVSAGRKNRLWFEISADSETFGFEQEHPDSLAVLRRPAAESVPRGLDTLSPEAARYVTVPAGHPQGYQECFDAFVAEAYAAIAGEPADGLPRLEDGLRAVLITEAVLESARQRTWVELPPGP